MHFVLLLPNTCKHSTHVCTALAYNETFQTPMQAICKQNHAINMKWAVWVCACICKKKRVQRTANIPAICILFRCFQQQQQREKNSNSQLLSSVMVVDRQMAKTTTWIIWKHTQSVYKKLCYLWAKKWLNWFPNWNERQSISIFMLGVFIRLKLISKFSKILLDNFDNTMPTWRSNEKKKKTFTNRFCSAILFVLIQLMSWKILIKTNIIIELCNIWKVSFMYR